MDGKAFCKFGEEFKLHPIVGCLVKDEYERRKRADLLYAKLYEILKYQRRRYISCDNTTFYKYDEYAVKYYFKMNVGLSNLNMNKEEFDESLGILFGEVLQFHSFDVLYDNKSFGYYANLSEWELNAASTNCMKLNLHHWMMMTKGFGLELMTAVISWAVLLITWRKTTF